MNVCNYNLNITILGFLPAFKINVKSLYVTKKHGVEGFTVRGGIEYIVEIEREIGEKDFKYINSINCRNSTWEHPLDCIIFYAFGFINKKMLMKIGFHG